MPDLIDLAENPDRDRDRDRLFAAGWRAERDRRSGREWWISPDAREKSSFEEALKRLPQNDKERSDSDEQTQKRQLPPHS